MDAKTKGSWLIHHANKLHRVIDSTGYENTLVAGKAGILLSAMSSNKERVLSNATVETLARAANINARLELPTLLQTLNDSELIDKTSSGVAVLGVTTTTALEHTANIFEGLNPNQRELAAIELAEAASIEPVLSSLVAELFSDKYCLDKNETERLIFDAGEIGFVDVEDIGGSSILFNGNIFRRDTTKKIMAVLSSLSSNEQQKLQEVTELLKVQVCINNNTARKILGDKLYDKVVAIGLFDINVVSNSAEDVAFMTLPSAFSKYSNSMVDDAFDLVKAFVSSITYGINNSNSARGQITMVQKLLKALVRGEDVGPVAAIAEDYKILELKGVVQVFQGSKRNYNGILRHGPMMRLLKKEVGELALQAIGDGDISEHSLEALPSAKVTSFKGPEQNREVVRRHQVKTSPKATTDMLMILRTGKGF